MSAARDELYIINVSQQTFIAAQFGNQGEVIPPIDHETDHKIFRSQDEKCNGDLRRRFSELCS
jgi:hypothetical protein